MVYNFWWDFHKPSGRRSVAGRSPEILITEAAAVDGSSQTVSYRQPSGWTLNPALLALYGDKTIGIRRLYIYIVSMYDINIGMSGNSP
jgi:hypothetical protein